MVKVAQKQTNTDSSHSATKAPQGSWKNQLAQVANNSTDAIAQRAFIAGVNDSPRMLAQRRQIESYLGTGQPQTSEPVNPDSPITQQQHPIQRSERNDDEEALQGKFVAESPAQLEQQTTPKPNNTGLPDNLKNGIESLSGMSMDSVKVHYNSSKPAQLNALAYAQGSDIHVARGQEQHLPHEAWHVVQQAQGRVQPTMQMKDGVPVNDDKGLEREADVMGEKAVQMKEKHGATPAPVAGQMKYGPQMEVKNYSPIPSIQRKVGFEFEAVNGESWKVQGGKDDEEGWKLVKNTKKFIYEQPLYGVQSDNGHIEFVTKPLSTWTDMTTAIGGIKGLADEWKDTSFNTVGGVDSWKKQGGFDKYKVNCSGEMIAKPQSTLGVSGKNIMSMLKHLTTDESKETLYKGVQETALFSVNYASKIIFDAICGEDGVIPGSLEDDDESFAQMDGLMGMILVTLSDANANSGRQLTDPKYAFNLMHRTDFKAMYNTLGLVAKGWFKTIWEGGELEKSMDANLENGCLDGYVFTGGYKNESGEFIQGPTRREWIASIFGESKDIMSPPPGYRKHGTVGMEDEGLGAMGADGQLWVMELRSFNNGKTARPSEWLGMASAFTRLVGEVENDANLMPPEDL